MKLGAEPNKIVILVALLVVAGVVFVINSGGDSGVPPQASPAAPAAVPGNPAAPAAGSQAAPTRPTEPDTGRRAGRGATEFRPSVRPKRGEERVDPVTIDPTLRLDLLAKLQEVKVEGQRRSIFDFSQPEPPKPDPKQAAASKTPAPSPLVKPEDKPAEAAKAAAEPEKPKAPPIPLKFYGYLSRTNVPAKRAFFMDGEEIHVVSEGDIVKKRYKIVRIGVNSVVVEDTQFEQQQTLPLEEQQPG
jgi:hypothetical protein